MPGRRRKPVFLLAVAALLLFLAARPAYGQNAEVRQKLQEIRNDDIPDNCVRATNWLFEHREALKDELLDALYNETNDKQFRDALLHVLFNTASFVPDERFVRTVLARLPEQDKKVPNASIFEVRDGSFPVRTQGVHWEAWAFINQHFSVFEPLLKEQIGRSNNVFVLWAAAWVFKKRDVLQNYSALFTPATLDSAAANLRADNVAYNASHAVRLFLLLGQQSLPALRKAANSTDRQSRYLASATIDALNGNHAAFVYLSVNLNLLGVPFGNNPTEPDWLEKTLAKRLNRGESDEPATQPIESYP